MPIGPMGWLRAIVRGVPLIILVFGGLLIHLALRLIEAPLQGRARPWTPHITQCVCRNAFRLLGIRYLTKGQPMTTPGAVVANHASWLDIFALNAGQRITFVAKSDVAGWAGIGWLARATGTVFVRRDPRAARAQIDTFRDRLGAGERLLFFPEGTSTDGLQVLPFKPTLFAAFLTPAFAHMAIQPVTVRYTPAAGQDPRFYGWWGNMDFGPHLLSTLAASPQGSVTVIYHPALQLDDVTDRKALAQQLENQVRAGLTSSP